MPIDLAKLKTELTTDPLARGYAAMGDEAAAVNLTTLIDRPADGSVKALLNYLLVNKNRTGDGTDTVTTSMLGRLILIGGAALASKPFGTTTASFDVTLDYKCSALALLEIIRNPNIQTLPYQSSTLQVLLTDMINAGVMKAADKTAIIAMSNNLQSRAVELGLGGVTTSDVARARAS